MRRWFAGAALGLALAVSATADDKMEQAVEELLKERENEKKN